MSVTIATQRRPVSAPTSGRSRRGLLAVLAAAQFIVALDYNIVYVALPQIGRDLAFAPQSLQWVVSAYAVAFGGLLLLGGRASDLFDRRKVFVAGLGVYAVASTVGAVAWDPATLVIARAAQGVGGALLFPATLALINSSFPEGSERNRALSVWGAAGACGLVLGSLAGGVLTGAFGWRAVFIVNVPLAVCTIAGALVRIAPRRTASARAPFDLQGAIAATTGVTLFVFALVQGPDRGWSTVDVGTLACSMLLLGTFAVVEGRAPFPLLPARLLRYRNLRVGMTVTFMFMATIGCSLYFLTFYFQTVHGYSPLAAGFAFLAPTAATCAGSMAAGRVASRYSLRLTLGAGLGTAAIGAAMIALSVAADASYLDVLPGFLVFGLGQGVAYTVMFGVAASGVDAGDQGIASGVASTTQQIGGAVGLALLIALTNHAGIADPATMVNDTVRAPLLLIAAGIALTTVLSIASMRTKRPACSMTVAS